MSYIYIFGNRELGQYKIGRTENVSKRFNSVSSTTPFTIEIITSWTCEQPGKLEALIHYAVREYRIKGEWFKLNETSIEQIKHLVQNFLANPPALKPKKISSPTDRMVAFLYILMRDYVTPGAVEQIIVNHVKKTIGPYKKISYTNKQLADYSLKISKQLMKRNTKPSLKRQEAARRAGKIKLERKLYD